MNQNTSKRINLQIALDVGDSASLLRIGREVAEHADWIEVGTPWIMQEGMAPVRAIREMLPGKHIVADLKIMDAGEHEAGIGFSAGADIVTVLGAASDATISGAIRAAHVHDGKVMVDLIQVVDILERLQQVMRLGAHYIGLHNAFDDLEAGLLPASNIAQFTAFAPQSIIIGGGIGSHNIAAIARHHPHTIIVGRSVTGASNPGQAAKELRRILDHIDD